MKCRRAVRKESWNECRHRRYLSAGKNGMTEVDGTIQNGNADARIAES
jgi:hypothetical protein